MSQKGHARRAPFLMRISPDRWKSVQAALAKAPAGRVSSAAMRGGVIFDLDGTLVDSLPGIAGSLNRALASLGFDQHADPDVRRFIGNGSYELARQASPKGTPNEAILAVERAFKEDYATTWPEGTVPYDGIPELLKMLAAAGVRMAVLSNKPHPFTVEIVERLFPGVPLDPVLGHRPEAPRKPHPDAAIQISRMWGEDPSACLFIGDSTIDLETAARAGMRPLAVAWGYHDVAALEEAGAGEVTLNVADLKALFKLF